MWTSLFRAGKTFGALSVEVATNRADYHIEQPLEIVGAIEGDAENSSIISERLNVNIGLEMLAQLLLDPLGGGIGGSDGSESPRTPRGLDATRCPLLGRESSSPCLDLTDGELLGNDLVGNLQLRALVLDRQERPRMTRRDL